jgi:hypothetical protein
LGRQFRHTHAVAAMPGGKERGSRVQVLDTKGRDFQGEQLVQPESVS